MENGIKRYICVCVCKKSCHPIYKSLQRILRKCTLGKKTKPRWVPKRYNKISFGRVMLIIWKAQKRDKENLLSIGSFPKQLQQPKRGQGKPWARNSMRVSRVSGRGSSPWATFYCFPRSLVRVRGRTAGAKWDASLRGSSLTGYTTTLVPFFMNLGRFSLTVYNTCGNCSIFFFFCSGLDIHKGNFVSVLANAST